MNVDQYLPAEDRLVAQPNRPDSRSAPESFGESAGFSISLSDIRTMAWRQRWMIGSLMAAGLVIGLIVTLLMTPIFQATATVQIRQENTNIVSGQDVTPNVPGGDAGRYLKTQELIIGSRAMAERVVKTLRLDRNDDFLVAMGHKVISNEVPAASRGATRTATVVNTVMSNVEARVPVDSRIASISFSSPDAQVAARVAQSYATNYIQSNIDTSLQSTEYARSFLGQQVREARDRLTNSERQAIAYARQAELIDASDAASSSTDSDQRAGRSLTTASLVRLNAELGNARAARIEASGRWQVAQRTPALQLPEVAQNATVAALLGDRSQAQSQLDQLRSRYRADYPEVQSATARIMAINAQIARITGDIRSSLRNAAQVAEQRESELIRAIGSERGQVLTEQQRRVELNVLSQGVETNRTALTDLLRRYNEVNAAAGIVANNLVLVDSAQVPSGPVRPRPFYNLAISLVLGLALGMGLAIAREAVDDTVRSPDDIEQKLGLPMLGATPKQAAGNTVKVENLLDVRSMLSESYSSIRAALDYSTANGRPHTLVVTSSAMGEGKSTTSLAIALDYARVGMRTLLVDADLRRPSLHRATRLPNKIGFIDVLMENASLTDLVQRMPESSLDVLTLGRIVPNPVQVLSSDALPKMIARYSADYDIIIFDTAPVMGIADTPLIGRMVDGVVMVVEAGRAHRGQAKATLKRLRETGSQVLGVVLTKFDSRDAGYNYEYYNYYYSYSQKKEE